VFRRKNGRGLQGTRRNPVFRQLGWRERRQITYCSNSCSRTDGEFQSADQVTHNPGAFEWSTQHHLIFLLKDGVASTHRMHPGEVSERAFLMQVAMAFGGVVLLLSIVETYGLLAYEVSLREEENGIRLALGCSCERIVRLLLHEEGRWLGLGAAFGTCKCHLDGYALRSRFYGAHSTSCLLGLHCYFLDQHPGNCLPATRAARQDPARTLRESKTAPARASLKTWFGKFGISPDCRTLGFGSAVGGKLSFCSATTSALQRLSS
jgi:hypothetical protein